MNSRLARYIGKRMLLFIPQLFGISVITFMLVRLLPGNPAYLIAGSLASKEAIDNITKRLQLDQPIAVQFWTYLTGLLHGDLGDSWRTGKSVTADIAQRVPATMELLVVSFTIALAIGIPLGVYIALHKGSLLDRGISVYGMLAGAVPEFWLGLIVIFVFFLQLKLAPSPLGQIDPKLRPPTTITGSFVVDALLTGNWVVFNSAISHLVLPVLTFSLTLCAPFLKMTRSTMVQVINSDYIRQAAAMGIPRPKMIRYALKNSLPPVVTLAGFLFSYSLGGAVLIETVFSWGGMGQYAVQSIVNSDYLAIQGFVLVSAVFCLLIYLLVDVMYVLLDPRIRI